MKLDPDRASAYARSLEDAKAAWTDDPYSPPPPVTAVAPVLRLEAWTLYEHVEGVHGWEWHDEGYEGHVWEAARCLTEGDCGI